MILFNCRIDTYNGRWCVTPDYPSGTYAYFIATNSRFIFILIVVYSSQSLFLTFFKVDFRLTLTRLDLIIMELSLLLEQVSLFRQRLQNISAFINYN